MKFSGTTKPRQSISTKYLQSEHQKRNITKIQILRSHAERVSTLIRKKRNRIQSVKCFEAIRN